MNKDKYTFNVRITKPCGEVIVLATLAESKWEAEEKTHGRFIDAVPLRSSYTASKSKLNKKYVNKERVL